MGENVSTSWKRGYMGKEKQVPGRKIFMDWNWSLIQEVSN